jgi:glycosyltransferase involved in cell wall biosynthesis
MSLGSMSWFGVTEGLLWFASEVFPRVRAQCPDATWRIVGSHPDRSIRRLATQPGVEVVGYVVDVAPVIASSRAAIVPLNVAGGIRMKLLDFLSWRIPVVATSLAARGFEMTNGTGLWRCDNPADFADTLVRLLADDALWLSAADSGAEYVARHHSPEGLRLAIRSGVDRAIRRHHNRAAQ